MNSPASSIVKDPAAARAAVVGDVVPPAVARKLVVEGEGVRRLPRLERRWVQRAGAETLGEAVAELERELRLPGPLCTLLALRGHALPDAARQFLKPRLDHLHDPFDLTDMTAAVSRLERALRAGETILVHGDYDVDGICSTALYTRVLRALGGRVVPFVPHRLRDGYDLGAAGVRAASAAGARLILTADCGTVAHDAVKQAAAAGMDVIITDHHTPGTALPPAVAVVNPNREDCAYPSRGLAGVGVAFKLCQALGAARGLDADFLRWHLDLVAVATIADLAPLAGENRVLVHFGLRVLAQTRNPGLRALMRCARIDTDRPIAAGQVSHVLAPRINASGRIGDAMQGVRLLLAEDEAAAEPIARQMEEENRTRRALDRATLGAALDLLAADYDAARDFGVVLAARGWHPGVIGIVASRVVEHIHRPTVLIAIDDGGGRARGSARSIPGFHLCEAIRDCGSLLERFGGHRQAAGLDIQPERIDAFREAFNTRARAALDPEDLYARVHIDLELQLEEANAQLHGMLRHFGPFGIGNPGPVMAARGLTLARPPRVVGDGHAKLLLRQNGARLEAIGFGMAEHVAGLDPANHPIDIVFQLQENRWNDRLQARLIDARRSV